MMTVHQTEVNQRNRIYCIRDEALSHHVRDIQPVLLQSVYCHDGSDFVARRKKYQQLRYKYYVIVIA